MHARKSNRRYIVAMAASLTLLSVLGPPMAMAQFMPGLPMSPVRPVTPVPAPAKMHAVQSEQMPVMYTDMKVTSRMHTVAQPHELASKAQYELAGNLLDTRVYVLRALNLGNSLEMVATLNNLGWMQEHLGRVGLAQKSYQAALNLLHLRAPAYAAEAAVIEYNLADMLMGEHRFLDAFHYYRAALQDMNSVPNPDRHAIKHIQQKYDVVRKLIIAEPSNIKS